MTSSVSSSVVSAVVSAVSKAGGSRFSPAATDYFARLDAAGLRVTAYDAANARLIDRLVANGGNFWPASGAFCPMAGSLYPGNGAALIPLKDGHDAGTLNAFVTGDWNAVTGLKGDGSTKYVDSNRNNNADGQDDQAMWTWLNEIPPTGTPNVYIGAGNPDNTGTTRIASASTDNSLAATRNRNETVDAIAGGIALGLIAISRDNSSNYIFRGNEINTTLTRVSQTPYSPNVNVFTTNPSAPASFSASRQPIYGIGPNLNGAGELAELDAALTEWKNALASA